MGVPRVPLDKSLALSWPVLLGFLRLATNPHLAALAIAHGAVLVSCNTDFARFPGLRWEHPASAT